MALDFYNLTPDAVMRATEKAGFLPTGEFLQLNSYENRVFRIKLEDKTSLVAKFYRPGRWNQNQLQNEHDFLNELDAEGIPVNRPLKMIFFEGIWVAFFPLFLGRSVTEILPPDWEKLGRLLARVHNVGERQESSHRLWMTSEHPNGWPALVELEKWVDPSLKKRYFQAAENLMGLYEDTVLVDSFFRIHGDLHKGNLLSRDEQFFLVDFDDHVMGPAIQDVWMLFSESEQFEFEKESLLKGYEELRDFPHEQWDWVPLMRGFRLVGYSAWIARRWKDPSFPRLFPDFNSYSYWAEETEALEKCLNQF
jgi:Ser/Thr protein kinase RdoA (MazF antagonist)